MSDNEVHAEKALEPVRPDGSNEVTMEIKTGTISKEAMMLIVTGSSPEEWTKVALRKWEHYIRNVLPSGNRVAVEHHERGLLKMVPFLLGRPDLQLTQEMEDRAYYAQTGNTRVAGLPMPDVVISVEEFQLQDETRAEPHEGKVFNPGPERDRSHEEISAGEPREDRFDTNDDPHRREEDIRPYPKHGLDFGPPILGEQDC